MLYLMVIHSVSVVLTLKTTKKSKKKFFVILTGMTSHSKFSIYQPGTPELATAKGAAACAVVEYVVVVVVIGGPNFTTAFPDG